MTNISNVYESVSSLFHSQDSLTHKPLDFNSARKHVQKLCIEGAKVAVGVAGFMAVSCLMNQQASSMAAVVVGAAVLGGSLFLASRVSVFFHDAVKIATALVLFQRGFLNLLFFPTISSIIPSVKGLSMYAVTMLPLNDLPSSSGVAYLNIFGRFIVGMYSLSLALHLAQNGSSSLSYVKNLQQQKHLIDKGVITLLRPVTYIATRALGYSA